MGQKVHPIGARLGIVRNHDSVWYAERADYRKHLITDIRVRDHLEKKLGGAALSRVSIERKRKGKSGVSVEITLHTARPGIVIGKKGEDIERLRRRLSGAEFLDNQDVKVEIEEIKKPDLNAKLVARGIARQLEARIMFRRAMKKALQNVMREGAEGVRVQVSGRLGGADIARTEWIREGRVPLHTLRADIDYAVVRASTVYGVIGVKVWIFKGELLDGEGRAPQSPER